MSMPRERRNSSSALGKSRPTIATTATGAKKLAATEKKVADPPIAFSTLPKGVSTLSNATEPTTTIFTCVFPLAQPRSRTGEEIRRRLTSSEVSPGDRPQTRSRACRNVRTIGDDRLRERRFAGAGALGGKLIDDHADDPLSPLRALLENAQHLCDVHVAGAQVPAVVIGDQRDGGEAHLRLAGELRLLYVRHADHVGIPLPVQHRFRSRRELRPLHADVCAALVD